MNSKILEIAAKTIKTSVKVAEEHKKEVPEIDGWYVWNPVKGGIAVLINAAGEKLAATSGISFEQHLKAFQNGRRN